MTSIRVGFLFALTAAAQGPKNHNDTRPTPGPKNHTDDGHQGGGDHHHGRLLKGSHGGGDHGRNLYVAKQQETLLSPAHLIEIDLLRGGTHATAVPRELVRGRPR